MCELFAMSALYPTTVRLSLDELSRHGGGSGPHRDGWGIAFTQDRDALVIREPGAANGPANFLYYDGDALFAHGHRRKNAAGEIQPPGLQLLSRSCTSSSDGVQLAGVALSPAARQQVTLLASVPLSNERWEPLAEGEIVVLREGSVVRRHLREIAPRNDASVEAS